MQLAMTMKTSTPLSEWQDMRLDDFFEYFEAADEIIKETGGE